MQCNTIICYGYFFWFKFAWRLHNLQSAYMAQVTFYDARIDSLEFIVWPLVIRSMDQTPAVQPSRRTAFKT